jgi:hypothetical protein
MFAGGGAHRFVHRLRGRRSSRTLGSHVLAGSEECWDELAGSPHARQMVAGYLEDPCTWN